MTEYHNKSCEDRINRLTASHSQSELFTFPSVAEAIAFREQKIKDGWSDTLPEVQSLITHPLTHFAGLRLNKPDATFASELEHLIEQDTQYRDRSIQNDRDEIGRWIINEIEESNKQ